MSLRDLPPVERSRLRWLANTALVASSILLAFALIEGILRWNQRLEALFEPLGYEPELASEGWKRCFVRDFRKIRKKGRIGEDLGGYVHDPDLGWDTPRHVRGARDYSLEKPHGVFRVLVTGDSYTYGAEVGDDDTYPRRLEMLLPAGEVVNFGVRAYGIDQVALKYLKYGRAYRPDLLVIAIWGPDYLRVPLTFYRFAKPLYVLDPVTLALALTHTPIPPPEEMYSKLASELGPFFFTYGLLRRVHRLSVENARTLEGYYEKWDPLVEAILRHLVQVAEQDGTPILFVLIETGEQFRTGNDIGNPCCERKHLLNILQRLPGDRIDLADELLSKYSQETVYESMYFHHAGIANGHFTPLGNQRVAELIAAYIHERFGVAVSAAVR
jgi:lysophospholipase L1-like esterase